MALCLFTQTVRMHQLHQEGAIRHNMSTIVRHSGRVKDEKRRFAREVSLRVAQALPGVLSGWRHAVKSEGVGCPHVCSTCGIFFNRRDQSGQKEKLRTTKSKTILPH